MSEEITVIKRNDKKEKYDPEKIEKIVIAAGLDEKEAKILSKKVTEEIEKEGLKEITSIHIRDKVIVEIQKLDKFAADKYIWYEKYKDKNYGVKI